MEARVIDIVGRTKFVGMVCYFYALLFWRFVFCFFFDAASFYRVFFFLVGKLTYLSKATSFNIGTPLDRLC